MMRLLPLFAALLAIGQCAAQTVTLPAEVKGKPGRLITVKATGDCTGIQWWTPSDDKMDVLGGFNGDPFTALVVGEAGTFKLVAVGVKDGKLSPFAVTTVTIGTPAPPIPPTPPVPPPVPAGDVAWLVVVEESAARTQQSRALLGDVPFWATQKAAGRQLRVYDKDDPAAAKYAADVAAGGGVPALIAIDKAGKTVKAGKLPADGPGVLAFLGVQARGVFRTAKGHEAIEVGGVTRLLTRIPPTAESLKRRQARAYGDVFGTIPRAEWQVINRSAYFTTVLDQQSHGSCVGFGSAGALEKVFWLTGRQTPDKLSGSFIYSFINGGQDNGAMIGDAVAVIKDKGTCSDALCGWDTIYSPSAAAVAEAQRYRALEVYTVANFEEAASAVQNGFVVVFAVMVGNSFTTLNSEGVCGFDAGPGNHCVHADGMRKLGNGTWVLDMANSWGTSFGRQGRGLLTARHLDSVQQDAYAIRAVIDDPQGQNPPRASLRPVTERSFALAW